MTNTSEIIDKAKYCLNCATKPCSQGCPLGNDTAGFINLAKKQKFEEAYRLLSKTTVMPALCGKICPHSKQCQGKCVRGIKTSPVEIGEIEAYIGSLAIQSDWKITEEPIVKNNKKVAIIGGGPAGLTCAAFLAQKGVSVTIFEKHDYLGGLLVHGIPDFRLDRNLITKTIDKILELGVTFKPNMELGKNLSIEDLENNFDAIFIAFGANIHSKMNIPGESLSGVFGGNEFLEEKSNIDIHGKTALVCGGGNVAMDVSRTLKKLGAEHVIVVYRRSEKEMPAERKEIEDAKNEGVEFLFQHNLIEIFGKDRIKEVELIKTELVQKEGDTRLSPVNITGSNYKINADYVFMALGSEAEKSVTSSLNVELDKYGKIIVDDKYQTTNKKIFAGGDLLSNKKIGSVAWAARHGRDASENILKFLGIE